MLLRDILFDRESFSSIKQGGDSVSIVADFFEFRSCKNENVHQPIYLLFRVQASDDTVRYRQVNHTSCTIRACRRSMRAHKLFLAITSRAYTNTDISARWTHLLYGSSLLIKDRRCVDAS